MPYSPTLVTTVEERYSSIYRSLLSTARSFFGNTTEQLDGSRLRDGLARAQRDYQRLSPGLQHAVLVQFRRLCSDIASAEQNWSLEGRIKVALALQAQAADLRDFNMSGSLSHWLAGAWLESGARASADASRVRALLDDSLRL